MRRIKSVTVLIRCVPGPDKGVTAELTLIGSKIRTVPKASGAPEGFHESDFITNFAPIKSIATGKGPDDGGLFELNFQDEGRLPFEGKGAVSQWSLTMPERSFDFRTISDILIRLSYTTRDGGAAIK